jgi:hypothetical protein
MTKSCDIGRRLNWSRQFWHNHAMPPDSPPRTVFAGGAPADLPASTPAAAADVPAEEGGPAGPEPTRFGDWERKGRCIDF